MKLPAYGNALLKARRAGMHPAVVTVVYGNDWTVPAGVTRLAVKPGEALDRDWRCVAGLPIEFLNRSDLAMFEIDDGEPLRVVAQIARWSAQIVIEEAGARQFADDLAYLKRGRWASNWPAWWSEEIEKIHGQNRKRWIEEATEYLARFAA